MFPRSSVSSGLNLSSVGYSGSDRSDSGFSGSVSSSLNSSGSSFSGLAFSDLGLSKLPKISAVFHLLLWSLFLNLFLG